jgi:hypothetical protein
MNKKLLIISILGLLLLAASYAVGVYFKADKPIPITISENEKATMGLAIKAVALITAEWNYDELKKLEHPKLSAQMAQKGQSFEEFFKLYKTLGNRKSDVTCQYLDGNVAASENEITTANYGCSATFEKDDAGIFLKFVKNKDTNNEFVIGAFRVTSPFFKTVLEKK